MATPMEITDQLGMSLDEIIKTKKTKPQNVNRSKNNLSAPHNQTSQKRAAKLNESKQRAQTARAAQHNQRRGFHAPPAQPQPVRQNPKPAPPQPKAGRNARRAAAGNVNGGGGGIQARLGPAGGGIHSRVGGRVDESAKKKQQQQQQQQPQQQHLKQNQQKKNAAAVNAKNIRVTIVNDQAFVSPPSWSREIPSGISPAQRVRPVHEVYNTPPAPYIPPRPGNNIPGGDMQNRENNKRKADKVLASGEKSDASIAAQFYRKDDPQLIHLRAAAHLETKKTWLAQEKVLKAQNEEQAKRIVSLEEQISDAKDGEALLVGYHSALSELVVSGFGGVLRGESLGLLRAGEGEDL
ncbi:hypothetical protein HK097_003672 [Rhizophlyctis rosea]|uniref:Uncharacterized protein n=1 Tax=Rhizophlyctis rosea TaxID=64517 RepID=A0AAD5S2B9_9FUNG|nr:hypothetical protein HK097_003672 [Rhizophlyctis rosea]